MNNTEDLLYFVTQALMIAFQLSMPSIVVAAGVGTLIAIIQALTQIQEQTLAFAIKLIAIGGTILLTSGLMGSLMLAYTEKTFAAIPLVGK